MTLHRIIAFLATIAIFIIVLPMLGVAFVQLSGVTDLQSYTVDFAAFWGAARLAVEGRAIAAFDEVALANAMASSAAEGPNGYFWLYPPTWHLAVYPLGWLPFWAAYPLFSLGALIVYLRAIQPYTQSLPAGWPKDLSLVLATPVVVIGTLNGNNGLLTAGVMLFAFRALSQGREATAGLWISVLTIKPMLGVLLPVALIAGRHWTAFLWASIGSAVIVGISTAVFGVDYWQAFLQELAQLRDRVEAREAPIFNMVTWFGFAYSTGFGVSTALAVQGLAFLIAAGLVGWAFWRDGHWLWKGGLLFLLIPMASPYSYHYEMAFSLGGILMLAGAGAVRSWLSGVLIAFITIIPVVAVIVWDPPLVALVSAPLVSMLVVVACWCPRKEWRDRPTAPSTNHS